MESEINYISDLKLYEELKLTKKLNPITTLCLCVVEWNIFSAQIFSKVMKEKYILTADICHI